MSDSKKTFRGLFEKEEYNYIYIPRIQRDYAQGRNNTEANNIRDNILDDISTKKALSWGIIFGVSENRELEDGTKIKCFIPVDGQQRLTTLYLLHLYGTKCHKIPFEHLKKFSYETRNASKDFISDIVKHWDGEKDVNTPLKEYIINQGWFLNYWILDPTVDAMLNMLTDIDKRFSNKPEIFENMDRISFEFLDLNNLKLNETLYLKMNSRGRKLSQFDKIKSEIDKILPKSLAEISCQFDLYGDEHLKTLDSFDEKWRYCIDRKWSELFWDRTSHTFDTSFLSFLTNYLIAYKGENYSYADELLSINCKEDEFYLPWKYIKDGINENECEYLRNMAAILNKLVYNIGRTDIITKLIKLPNNYLERAKTFGLISFQGTDYSSKEFAEWKRFIRNYATNTVAEKTDFFAFAKRIKEEFSQHSTNILTYLAEQYNPQKYDSSQLNEEYFKACVLLNGEEKLQQAIRCAEEHPLLEGRLRPLISDGNEYNETFFLKVYYNFCELFGKDGDKLTFRDRDENSLLSRIQFATAFVKGLTHKEQMGGSLFDLSKEGLKENLKREQLKQVFRRCLLSDQLRDIEEAEWKDSDIEYCQLKAALLQPGVIQGILKYKKKSRFQWYHNCLCLYPYNGRCSADRIGFDRIKEDEIQWTRNRNQVLSYLISKSYSVQEKPVSAESDVALWWGSDIRFRHPEHQDIQLWWNADYNIGIINDDSTWVKRHQVINGKNDNYLFYAVGMNEKDIENNIEELIQEFLK